MEKGIYPPSQADAIAIGRFGIFKAHAGGNSILCFLTSISRDFFPLSVILLLQKSQAQCSVPPLTPPSGSLLKEVIKHHDLRALYLPPSVAEQLLAEPNGIDFFKNLDIFLYTGAPFSPEAGEKISKVTHLCPLYGSTEAFQVPQLQSEPED